MIVVAIIGILAAIAIPRYIYYISRTRAKGAAAEIDSTKEANGVCNAEMNTFTGHSASQNGVPTISQTKKITTITSVTNGVIKVTTVATTIAGLGLTTIDTTTFNTGNTNILWRNTGTVCNTARGLKPGQGDFP